MIRPLAFTVLLLLAPCIAKAQTLRTWTDATGKFRVKAELIEIGEDTVKIRKEDGQEVTVPIARLSELDKRYLERQRRETDAVEASPEKPAPIPDLPKFEKVNRQEAVAKLQSFGATLQLRQDGGVHFVNLGSKEIPEGGLAYLASLPELAMLNLTGAKGIKDEDLAVLAVLPNLVWLSLNNVPLEGSGLSYLKGKATLTKLSLRCPGADARHVAHLSGLVRLEDLEISRFQGETNLSPLMDAQRLEFLTIADMRLKPGTLRCVQRMPNLVRLWAGDCGLTDDDLAPVKACVWIESFWLHNGPRLLRADQELPSNDLTAAGLAHLAGMKNANQLSLARNKRIDDEALKLVATMAKLKDLELHGTAVTDKGVALLAGLQQLESLDLRQTAVTDACLPVLARLPKLNSLDIDEERFSKEALEKFKQSAPQVDVY